MKKSDILSLFRSGNTVFSFKDISLIWGETKANLVRRRLSYYVKKGELYPVRRGFYAKDKNYNKYELAVKIYTPSYISFETVLAKAGVIFQFYGQIFIASYLTREIKCDSQVYSFKKIKDSILTNKTGIEVKDNYFVATSERAFLDVVYLNKEYYFDNLDNINWKKVYEILPIYNNNRMEKKIKKYQEAVQKELN